MAHNDIDVTAVGGDVEQGPLWVGKTVGAKLPEDFTWDETMQSAYTRLGEGSTDGLDEETETETTEKKVWGGKSLGITVSSFSDKFTIRFASAADLDVLRYLHGDEQVVVNTEKKVAKVIQMKRTPPALPFIIQSKMDDGRPMWFVIPKAQLDPALSVTYSDEDIVVYEATVQGMAYEGNRTSYRLIGLPDGTVEVAAGSGSTTETGK
jgi:hypothetical protein